MSISSPRRPHVTASPQSLGAKLRDRAWLGRQAERYVTLVAFALMIAVFWAMRPESFGTWVNFRSVLDQAAIIVLLSVGLTVVLAVGEFDLSFPFAIGLASAAGALMMTKYGLGPAVAIVVGLGTGVLAGIVVGAATSLQRASSFIVTLAFGFVWKGTADAVTGSQTIADGITNSFVAITDTKIWNISLAVFVAAGFSLIAAAMLRYTVFGRYLQSVGSNPEAARLAGLGLTRIRIAAYAFLGLGAATAALIITSRQAQYTPGIGEGLFLQPYVAAFFGMSVLATRRFNVFGTVIGALFIGALETGLIMVQAEAWVGRVVQGGVLAVIVLAARRARGR